MYLFYCGCTAFSGCVCTHIHANLFSMVHCCGHCLYIFHHNHVLSKSKCIPCLNDVLCMIFTCTLEYSNRNVAIAIGLLMIKTGVYIKSA